MEFQKHNAIPGTLISDIFVAPHWLFSMWWYNYHLHTFPGISSKVYHWKPLLCLTWKSFICHEDALIIEQARDMISCGMFLGCTEFYQTRPPHIVSLLLIQKLQQIFRWEGWGGEDSTVYPKKYAHGFCFAVLCCGYTLTDFPISIRLTSLALWQSNDCPSASKATLMNMDKYFMWIHY